MDILDRNRCKAARALLDWTASELSERSGLSADTLRSFESGRSRSLNRENEAILLRTFDAAGVRFIAAGETAEGPGVVLK